MLKYFRLFGPLVGLQGLNISVLFACLAKCRIKLVMSILTATTLDSVNWILGNWIAGVIAGQQEVLEEILGVSHGSTAHKGVVIPSHDSKVAYKTIKRILINKSLLKIA